MAWKQGYRKMEHPGATFCESCDPQLNQQLFRFHQSRLKGSQTRKWSREGKMDNELPGYVITMHATLNRQSSKCLAHPIKL